MLNVPPASYHLTCDKRNPWKKADCTAPAVPLSQPISWVIGMMPTDMSTRSMLESTAAQLRPYN